jgi:leader peptidase (prepilin peptidase) / N-methyltransferase
VFNVIAWPIELRIILVILIGLVTARFINWAIYTWAYFPRKLGPWCLPNEPTKTANKNKKSAAKIYRGWQDHLPVVGWWRLRRESDLHGNKYWLRPLLIEFLFPLALAWYYRFQMTGSGLPPAAAKLILPLDSQLHVQFVGHWVLLTLMTIATFIDFDEQSIPDYVTIPGTVIGILGATFSPIWFPLMPSVAGLSVNEMHAGWPAVTAPVWFNSSTGLAVALIILAVWGFALLDRRVILRRGFHKALVYFWARMFRYPPLWVTVLVTTGIMMIFVIGCWFVGIARWDMLMSSLLGMAFAGGVTWAARVSASYGYGMEALGFGDVTLMAMIGAYIGWQPSLAVFFLAPFVAMVFVIIRWIVTRDAATPYGPYLCAAVVLLLVSWEALWLNRFALLFFMAEETAQMINNDFGLKLTGADVILGGMAICVLLIGGMLWLWLMIRRMIFGDSLQESSE